MFDVVNARMLPRVNCPVKGITLVVSRNARPEKTSNVPPTLTAGEIAGYGKYGSSVKPPQNSPSKLSWHRKLKTRDGSTGLYDSGQLGHSGLWVVNVAE